MKALLDKGADPNVRLNKKVWYSGYSFDLSGVDETGATPFWRAAYASDVDAMKMLVAYGADPNIRDQALAGRPRAGDVDRDVVDVSGLPPVAVGGPAVTPLQAAAGVGYGEGFAANSHRFAPAGMLAAVKYLVEELHADVNAPRSRGQHRAAPRRGARRRRDDSVSGVEGRRREGGEPGREDHRGHGQWAGPAHPAVSRGGGAAREAGREEQPQVRLLLAKDL